MDITQDLIAIGLGLRDDADRQKIEDLIEAFMLGDHFFVNGIQMLGATENAEFESVFAQHLADLIDHFGDLGIALAFLVFD